MINRSFALGVGLFVLSIEPPKNFFRVPIPFPPYFPAVGKRILTALSQAPNRVCACGENLVQAVFVHYLVGHAQSPEKRPAAGFPVRAWRSSNPLEFERLAAFPT
jgi:hypothetical protein